MEIPVKSRKLSRTVVCWVLYHFLMDPWTGQVDQSTITHSHNLPSTYRKAGEHQKLHCLALAVFSQDVFMQSSHILEPREITRLIIYGLLHERASSLKIISKSKIHHKKFNTKLW